jgi:hypothetical protein
MNLGAERDPSLPGFCPTWVHQLGLGWPLKNVATSAVVFSFEVAE